MLRIVPITARVVSVSFFEYRSTSSMLLSAVTGDWKLLRPEFLAQSHGSTPPVLRFGRTALPTMHSTRSPSSSPLLSALSVYTPSYIILSLVLPAERLNSGDTADMPGPNSGAAVFQARARTRTPLTLTAGLARCTVLLVVVDMRDNECCEGQGLRQLATASTHLWRDRGSGNRRLQAPIFGASRRRTAGEAHGRRPGASRPSRRIAGASLGRDGWLRRAARRRREHGLAMAIDVGKAEVVVRLAWWTKV